MNLLPRSFTRGGFIYKQIRRNAYAAIFTQSDQRTGKLMLYEVWRVRFQPARILGGAILEESERKPSDAEWGQHGWTYRDFPAALAKYNKLSTEAEEAKNPDPAQPSTRIQSIKYKSPVPGHRPDNPGKRPRNKDLPD